MQNQTKKENSFNRTQMKISKLNLTNLLNEEHLQFHTEFLELVNNIGAINIGIEAPLGGYNKIYEQEKVALQNTIQSATTEQLADANDSRDIIFRGLSDAIRLANNHFNPTKKAAAKRLGIVLFHIGKLAPKPYNEETASLKKLIKELQTTYQADVAILALTDWITELDARNKAFEKLIQNRYTQDAHKIDLLIKQVRTELDEAYRAITYRIEALILLNNPATYEPFVQQLNALVSKYSNIVIKRPEEAKTSFTKASFIFNITPN